MGKWTTGYYDDVLSSKIKSLVTGAMKRSRLEKAEPTISFEAFVEDLDPGDSFTTTIIEILVKELAERRQRPKLEDRRLVSSRTAKSLRMLAAPQRIYPAAGGPRARRTLNLTDYLSAPPEEMEVVDDDNDSLESLMDGAGGLEGARVNTDLYDAYVGPAWASSNHAASQRRLARHVLRDAADESRPRANSTTGPSASSSTSASSSSTLTRQSTIRRPPARSRTVDFNDFTTRRRSSTRDAHEDAPSPRRFFPPTRRLEYPWPAGPAAATDHGDRGAPVPLLALLNGAPPTPSQRTFVPSDWRHVEDSEPRSDMPTPAPETDDEAPRPAPPRLRRGGVRPPEAMLAQHHHRLDDEASHVGALVALLSEPGESEGHEHESSRPVPVSVPLQVRRFSPPRETP
ncbi:hypothetical protein EVG20_g8970 [Dentipellis fragilis]|uniref:Uncharacterized protein n=1 Tax=Dentipellis fragilis TaxID=205917 RepID=A0A4Y9Y232_9AGAM|nr:hypothetical protein EVG20_g8970 [Dentipellis fragilis]